MSRNRVIYQSQALYVGPSPATGQHFSAGNTGTNNIKQLYRVQSCNYSFSIPRQDVNQFGELAAIDRVSLESPTVSLDVNYLLSNFNNEKSIGFVVDGTVTCLSGILNKTADEKNYFIKVVGEGVDAKDDTTTAASVIGFGNGFISSYSSEASVGNFPTVSLRVEGLNMTFENGISGSNPAVTPSDGLRVTTWKYTIPTANSNPGAGNLDISTLRPGDITMSFKQRSASDEGSLSAATGVYNTAGADINDAKIQSYSLSLGLNRGIIQRLGNKFAFSREITFPVVVGLNVDAIVGDLTTGSLSDIINCDSSYDVTIQLKQPDDCTAGANKAIICQYVLKNAKLNSQSFSSNIGNNKSVSLEFSSQIGGPNQGNIGLFMSGLAA